MGVTWTSEQQKVIDLRDRNILVSAAAGSGKTAVLVERIITMLMDESRPVDVDRLLIVTFTEAAAAEMKDRIRNAIEKKLEEDPDNEHLLQQSILIHSAQITTIHSFCLSVIRDHFHAIDIDPGFRVGEEGELKLLRHDVLDEIMEEKYLSASERFLDLTAAYGGKNDRKLEELILKLYEFSRSYPDADAWLEDCVKGYQVKTSQELEETIYVKLIKENTEKILEDAKGLIREGLSLCQEADGPYEYEKTLLKDLDVVEGLCGAQTYAQLYERFQGVSWPRLAPKKDKSVSEDKTKMVKELREDYKGYIKTQMNYYFFQNEEEMLEDLKCCLPYMEELAEMIKLFADRFEEKKRSRNMIDFSDMEQYALRILTEKKDGRIVPSGIARDYQEQFQEIMIDEYQDSNLIQEEILTSVSGVSQGVYNIFMVGDVKQSIYRFRLSRPELFMEKYDTYSTKDNQTQRIDLHKNFRSRKEVLESVNCIFRQIMIRELGGIRYDSSVALNVGAAFEPGEDKETEVIFVDGEEEAKVIANRIQKLMETHKVTDKKTGKERPLKYSDIVILTRSISGFAEPFARKLNQEGIPTHAGTREGYFSTQEIGVVLSYLRVLDNQQQDIPLAAVLSSAVGKMSEKDMALIKSAYKEMPFYRAVMEYRKNGEDVVVREKLERCMGQIEEFRQMMPYTSIQELLCRILNRTGYGNYVSAMPGGEQRKANLDMLVEKARAFEATSYKGLFHFVRYIEQLRKYDVDFGEANLEDEQSDNVKIMTIHKSKGLEFPVVFVAGMGKGFNLQDARSTVALHARLGVGLDAVNMKKRTRCPSLIKKIIQREEVLDTLGEELRILYVAFTRAKEKLIITGVLPEAEKKLCAPTPVLSFGQLSKASRYWDWIIPAVMHLSEESLIKTEIVTKEDIIEEEILDLVVGKVERHLLENWDESQTYDPYVKEQIETQFHYEYPYKESHVKKMKYTVSELKKQVYEEETAAEGGEIVYQEPEVVPLLPKFMQQEEELTGALRGTAYHRILELLDFTKKYDSDSLETEIKHFCKSGKIETKIAECIRTEDILTFLNSSAGQRMYRSAKKQALYKEQPFVLGIEEEEELFLVQGIIDVYFEEEDGLVVLDYKTDRVRVADELVEKYHAQLEYYAKALEQLTRKRVKEKLIYSFTLKEEISL